MIKSLKSSGNKLSEINNQLQILKDIVNGDLPSLKISEPLNQFPLKPSKLKFSS